MVEINKSVLVDQSAARMFALVDDVEKYPDFLPWCGGSAVSYRDSILTRATIQINYRGIRQSFSTENTKCEPDSMQIRLVEGPFRTLEGTWRFLGLGDGNACKVELNLRYEFAGRLLEKLVGPVFGHIANSLVDAFVKRAHVVYDRK
jgi:ribosome-associated toxin RatA of RatAB toxin-antitoxin module